MPLRAPYARSAWVTWMHSSRVGVRTRAWTSWTDGSTCSIIGSPKAAVLPDPVWAWPIMSRPSMSGGIACSWIGLGDSYPTSRSAASVGSESPRSAKVVTATQTSGLPSPRRVEQLLAARAPLGEVDLGLRGVAERVGVAHHRPQLTALHAREEVGQRVVDHRRAVEAVPQPEPGDGVAAAQQAAGAHLVLLARGDPVDDEAPERRQRLGRLLEDLPARRLEDHVEALAVVG